MKQALTRSQIIQDYMSLHPDYEPVKNINHLSLNASQRIDAMNIYKAYRKSKRDTLQRHANGEVDRAQLIMMAEENITIEKFIKQNVGWL